MSSQNESIKNIGAGRVDGVSGALRDTITVPPGSKIIGSSLESHDRSTHRKSGFA